MNLSATLVKTMLVAAVLAPPVLSFADCPEGVRSTTSAEQQKYLATMTALKAALPASVAGWDVQFAPFFTSAPSSVCKGSPLTAGYEATYTSSEQRKKNQESDQQYEARIEAVRKLSPEEQKQADDLYNQGKALGYQAIAALKNKDQAESDRLRAEANKKYAESKAIQQGHLEKVFPQMKAIEDEKQKAYVSPEVKVHLLGRDLAGDPKGQKTEPAPIEGVSAYFAADKALVVSLGTGPDGQPVWARLEGDRANTQAIARLLSHVGSDGAGASQLQSKNR